VIYAVLSGLRPNFASYVTRQRPQTLEQLTEAARVAELTTAENDQFTEVKTEIRKLAARWDQMTAAPIVQRRDDVERRTPSPFHNRRFNRNRVVKTGTPGVVTGVVFGEVFGVALTPEIPITFYNEDKKRVQNAEGVRTRIFCFVRRETERAIHATKQVTSQWFVGQQEEEENDGMPIRWRERKEKEL